MTATDPPEEVGAEGEKWQDPIAVVCGWLEALPEDCRIAFRLEVASCSSRGDYNGILQAIADYAATGEKYADPELGAAILKAASEIDT